MLETNKQSFIIKIGVLIWSIWLLVNFFIHHPSYFYAITEPPYLSLVLTLVFISIGTAFYVYNKKGYILRGWKIYLFFLLLLMIIYYNFTSEGTTLSGSLFKHQFFFLLNNILLHLATFFIFLCCFAAGNRLVRRFKKNLTTDYYYVVSLALGIALFTLLVFILGVFGFLKTEVLIPFIVVLLVWQRKSCWSFFRYTFLNPINTKNTSFTTYILVMILLIFTGFYLIGAMKVFPLGYDSARLYQSLTKNIIESQVLIKGGQAYNWPLFTAIGPLLFKSMVFSIFISHAVGLLCLWAMYHIGRIFLNKFSTWLAITIYYTLPASGFLHFVDAKVDLGFLFICLSLFIFILKYGKSIHYDFSSNDKTTRLFFILIGILLGFAMGIKYLALLLIISVILIFIYQWGGAKSYLGALLFTISALFLLKINTFGYLEITSTERYLIAGVSFLMGVAVLAYYYNYFNWKKGLLLGRNILILFAISLLTFMPWALKNTIESSSLSIKNVLYGKSSQKNLKHDYSFLLKNNIPFRVQEKHKKQVLAYLKKEGTNFNLDDKSFVSFYKTMKKENKDTHINTLTKRKNTGKREEILRYLGYEPGLNRYLSLPYDVTMGTNIPNKRGLNITFIFLLFLPLFVLSFKNKKSIGLKNSIGIIFISIVLLISWNTITYSERSFNIPDYLSRFNPNMSTSLTSFGNTFYFPFLYVQDIVSSATQPLFNVFSTISFPFIIFILFGISFLIAWISKENWKKHNTPVKLVIIFITTYGFLWWFLGNGITYYALVIWVLGAMLITYYYENMNRFYDAKISPFIKSWMQTIFSIFLIFNIFILFSNKTNNWKDAKNLFFEPFISHYSTKFIAEDEFNNKKVILPIAATVLNKDPSSKIYKVGTYIKYHINQNDSRVFEDDQLNIFDQTSKLLKNQDDFLTVLKSNGVKYIVFNLKVASIDRTPEKTLVDKANRLVKVLNNKKRVRLIMTDNKVSRYDPKSKKEKTGYGLVGKTIEYGSMAVFELL